MAFFFVGWESAADDGHGDDAGSYPRRDEGRRFGELLVRPEPGPAGEREHRGGSRGKGSRPPATTRPYLDPIGQWLLNLYPIPNHTDPDNRYNYVFNPLVDLNRNQGVVRLDYNITDNTPARSSGWPGTAELRKPERPRPVVGVRATSSCPHRST